MTDQPWVYALYVYIWFNPPYTALHTCDSKTVEEDGDVETQCGVTGEPR